MVDDVTETDQGLNFVTLVLEATEKETRWCAIWMTPPSVDPARTYRFRITTPVGRHLASPNFQIAPSKD